MAVVVLPALDHFIFPIWHLYWSGKQSKRQDHLTPEIIEQDGGILVTLFKNKYSSEQLQKLGLNERQLKALLSVVEHTSITNSKYQEINGISKRTATNDLTSLVTNFNLFEKSGTFGAGISYHLKGQ